MKPVRHLVLGQVELAELEIHVAPLGHRQRVAVGLGEVLEDRAHLVGRLHVELVARELPAVGIAHGRAGLDAEQRLVSARVIRLEIVRVVGATEGGADGAGDLDGALGHRDLLLEAVRLHLHEVVVLAEHLLVPARGLERLGLVPGGELPAHLGVEAAREHEQPVRVLGQQLPVHPRLVVVALEVGLGDQLHEVGVTGPGAREHRAVARALVAAVLARALEAAARGHVELAAQDRLHPRLLAGGVEVHRAEEVAVIGEREGRELQRLGALDQLLEAGRAVQQAVLGVDVQMDEVGVFQGGLFQLA